MMLWRERTAPISVAQNSAEPGAMTSIAHQPRALLAGAVGIAVLASACGPDLLALELVKANMALAPAAQLGFTTTPSPEIVPRTLEAAHGELAFAERQRRAVADSFGRALAVDPISIGNGLRWGPEPIGNLVLDAEILSNQENEQAAAFELYGRGRTAALGATRKLDGHKIESSLQVFVRDHEILQDHALPGHGFLELTTMLHGDVASTVVRHYSRAEDRAARIAPRKYAEVELMGDVGTIRVESLDRVVALGEARIPADLIIEVRWTPMGGRGLWTARGSTLSITLDECWDAQQQVTFVASSDPRGLPRSGTESACVVKRW